MVINTVGGGIRDVCNQGHPDPDHGKETRVYLHMEVGKDNTKG